MNKPQGCHPPTSSKSVPAGARRRDEIWFDGSVICPGIGIGRIRQVDLAIEVTQARIAAEAVPAEQERYREAVKHAKAHIMNRINSVQNDTPAHLAEICETQRAFFGDEGLHLAVADKIATDLQNAEWALGEVSKGLMLRFSSMRDPFFQARAEDLRDMVTNILDALSRGTVAPILGTETVTLASSEDVHISPHLHPSAAIRAMRVKATGFASESRALTSHAAILLEGFGIPSVGNVTVLLALAKDGDEIIIDAVNGGVMLHPSPATVARYRKLRARIRAKAESTPEISCKTIDGTEIRLTGNIGNPDQAVLVVQRGLHGVGLFRTEFVAMLDGAIPSEDEQSAMYRDVMETLHGRELVIRTFDIGGDKQMSSLQASVDLNPALGLRGIRRHLRMGRAELQTQLRAIIRAAGEDRVGVLIPMVTTIADVLDARQEYDEIARQLHRAAGTGTSKLRFGVMIETPAAAIQIAEIFKHVDFVSLGTNDLLQFFMAADRNNEEVVDYIDSADPGFQWLLAYIITQAIAVGRQYDVSICGELASNPQNIAGLLKMGYRSFSISPVVAEKICAAIGQTDLR